VAGTEDKQLHSFKEPKPNSELRNSGSHSILKLTLRPGGYEWEFIPTTEGAFKDSGSSVCH
jgi:acid phosphatase type 7